MNFLHILEQIRTPIGDILFRCITLLGEEIFVIALLCLIYWCIDKKLAYKTAFAFFASGLFVQALKITFRIPRPWILDPDFRAVESAVPSATGYSFPSGHTQSGTALFFSLALASKKHIYQLALCFLFIAIGFSRMYLGVHTPQDVITSMILTIIITYAVYKIIDFIYEKPSKVIAVTGILLFISAALIVYTLILWKTGLISMDYASDSCKAAGAGIGFAIGWYIERKYIRFNTQAPIIIQAVKYMIGLISTLTIKLGLKAILGSSLFISVLSYCLVILWVIAGYPAIMNRTFIRRTNRTPE